jgi:hypothetical protein
VLSVSVLRIFSALTSMILLSTVVVFFDSAASFLAGLCYWFLLFCLISFFRSGFW